MTGIQNVLRRVFYVDLRSLAVFRMALSFMLLVDLYYRFCNLEVLFTDRGFLPREGILEAYGDSIRWTSLHFHTGQSVALQGCMLAIAGVVAVALLLGYKTWTATLVSWLLFVSINRRIPSTCYGFDDVMRLMLFWSLFLPMGGRWSWDSRKQTAPQSNQCFSVASAAILLQVCYVYWFTAIWKLHPDWLEGRAMRYALELDYAVRPIGRWIATQPWITVPVTYATLVMEFLVPFVALSPWKNDVGRWIAITVMWSLHLGIWLCLSIGLFPPIALAYWLLFIPSSSWDAFEKWRGVAGDEMKRRPFALPWWPVLDIVAAGLLIQVTLYNIVELPQLRRMGLEPPRVFTLATELMRIDQKWILYAPTPNGVHGYFGMPARLADGTTVDIWLLRPVGPIPPELMPGSFRDFRITQLFMKTVEKKESPIWPWVAKYVMEEWNHRHPENKAVNEMQIVFVGKHEGKPFVHSLYRYEAP